MSEASLIKIRIFGDDHEIVFGSMLPDSRILRPEQSDISNVGRSRINIRQLSRQPERKVLIEEQLHRGAEKSRRSRSAAKRSAARISSEERSGKSARISSCDIPEARYSRMS